MSTSPLMNQDGVSRNFAQSEMENNRIHKEVVDAHAGVRRQQEETEQKALEVQHLDEQDALDPEAQKREQEKREAAKQARLLQERQVNPPAHLGGGDVFDFSA